MRCLIGLLVLGQLLGCRPASDVAPDLLYRTYTYPQKNSGSPDRLVIVELTRPGEVRFGENKELARCCAPTRFLANGTTLVFLGPEVPDPICAFVDCRLSELSTGISWQIEQLNRNGLIIAAGQQRILLTAR